MESSEITILLVDDEPDTLEFLGYSLEKEGYKVLKAKNGHEALNLARENRPQLVILDVMMEGMDGMETCTEIRKIPELGNTMIAFLTARGEEVEVGDRTIDVHIRRIRENRVLTASRQ